jgi:hypothetical protein
MARPTKTKGFDEVLKVERVHRLNHPDSKTCRACHFKWPCSAYLVAQAFRRLIDENRGIRSQLNRARLRKLHKKEKKQAVT